MSSIKHLWTLNGDKFNFCVKCGAFKDSAQSNRCPMTVAAFKKKHKHSAGKNKCIKCGLNHFIIYYFPTKTKFGYLGIRTSANASVKNSKYPYVEIYCTMDMTDWMIKDVIE